MFTKSMFRIFTLLFVMTVLLTVVLLPVQAKSSARPLQASGDLLWAAGTGGNGSDTAKAIAVGATGNVYTIGSFQGTVDFDPGVGIFNLTSTSTSNSFISKLDGNGNLLWAKTIGAIDPYQTIGIALDSNENIYLTRGFQGTVNFDPGAGVANLTSAGDTNIIVSKLDSDGNFIWAGNIGGTGSYESHVIALDSSGNVYTIGWFTDTNPSGSGYFISKLNSNGEFVWVKSIGTRAVLIKKFAVDTSGNVYIAGAFVQTVDFDPNAGVASLTSVGGTDIFIFKLDSDGNFIWAKSMGGISDDGAFGIAIDSSGNPYLIGPYVLTVDFDPNAGITNLTSVNGYNIFICKLDASGNFVWVRSTAQTSDPNQGSTDLDITIDLNNNVYTTSIFSGTVDFDPGAGTANLTSAGDTDIFISKLDGNGSFMWAKRMGGAQTDKSNGIALDLSGNLYTAGYFMGTADFDPGAGTANLTSAGDTDIFISKLENDTLAPTATATGTITPTESETLIPTVTATETVTPTATATFTPTSTQTATVTTAIAHTPSPTKTATPITLILKSIAAQDGWVLESSENSSLGGTINSTSTVFTLGDDGINRQYRSILSFNTAYLPDNAVILSAVLKIKGSSVVGTNPFGNFGSLVAQIKQNAFSNNAALQMIDFSTTASMVNNAAVFSGPVGAWYSAPLNASARTYLDHSGLTQFRLAFAIGDNNNNAPDNIRFLSGNAAVDQPQLVITYYLP